MEREKKDYTNFDYLNLVEIYFKNEWIRKKANFIGFENLWNDYASKSDKNIVKKLISNFTYLTADEAYIRTKDSLIELIKGWQLTHKNCKFIATRLGDIPDGSNVYLNFIKSIIVEIDINWGHSNFSTSIEESKKSIGLVFKEQVIDNFKIILVDDFVGTGRTANERIKKYEEDMIKLGLSVEVYFFSLAGMKMGFKLLDANERKYKTCMQLKKGTQLSFAPNEIENSRESIKMMERILSNKIKQKKLSKYTLGWGRSEALYSWEKFNIPNNVYPIFWWSLYNNQGKRKTMFNRMQ